MGSVFIAGFGFNNILLLLLLPNRILRSLDKMINDKEMEEILDEMKKGKMILTPSTMLTLLG